MAYSFTFFHSLESFPKEEWERAIGCYNRLLSYDYLRVLYESAPKNMQCCCVGYYKENDLVGGALFQIISLKDINVFGANGAVFNAKNIANYVVKKIAPAIFIVGNNMFSGHNAFYFNSDKMSMQEQMRILHQSVKAYEKETRGKYVYVFKDFIQESSNRIKRIPLFSKFRLFSVQPSMVFTIRQEWETYESYLNSLSAKYRTRARAARKKMGAAKLKELTLDDLVAYKNDMRALYMNVVDNAGVNTFLLEDAHFIILKKHLGEDCKIFGYFDEDRLIGFFTLIRNGEELETYFLGYDAQLQKDRQLYLNMLLDMIKYGIEARHKRINFGRTALEIKSTIGAKPVPLYLFAKHRLAAINIYMRFHFKCVYKPLKWIPRDPFKQAV